jgi:hypothetical protein
VKDPYALSVTVMLLGKLALDEAAGASASNASTALLKLETMLGDTACAELA